MQPKHWYFGIIFILLAGYIIYISYKKQSLYNNPVITPGYVYEINHGSVKGGNIVIKYYFIYNGKKYYGGVDSGLLYGVRNKLLKTYFPILFDKTDPGNNVILINEKRWLKLGKELPDSLKWIKDYYP